MQWRAHNLRVGSATFDVSYSATADTMTFQAAAHNAAGMTIEFAPALSSNAHVLAVDVDGAPAKYAVEKNATDQHVVVEVPAAEHTAVHIRFANDFALIVGHTLPALGGQDTSLKIVQESWAADGTSVSFDMAGLAGHEYLLPVRGSAKIAQAEGADLENSATGVALRVHFPAGEARYRHARVTIRFDRR